MDGTYVVRAIRHCFQGPLHIPQTGNLIWVDQKVKKNRTRIFHLSGSIWQVIGRVITWLISKNGKQMKVVALHCSFLNLFELCSKVLPLWRYEVKDFFNLFGFFSIKTTPDKMISTNLESWEKGLQLLHCEKNDQRRKVHTLKGNLSLTDCIRLLIDYKSQL